MTRKIRSYGEIIILALLLLLSNQLHSNSPVRSLSSVTKVFYQPESPRQCFGMQKLKLQLKITRKNSPEQADLLVLTSTEQFEKLKLANEFSQLRPEGFML